jgi:geranylgeranyl pyrophosphate synthase
VDLREGHLTLPSLLAIKDSPAAKKAIIELVATDQPKPEKVMECVDLVNKTGAIQKARGMAEYYGIEATGHLGCLPRTAESQALREIVKKVLERDS